MPQCTAYHRSLWYKQSGEDITEITDNWTYNLDRYRYCKHIYAMKYIADEFPTEPSDFPIDAGLMSEWENMLIDQTILEQTKSFNHIYQNQMTCSSNRNVCSRIENNSFTNFKT